jgi:hypothetical protein
LRVASQAEKLTFVEKSALLYFPYPLLR